MECLLTPYYENVHDMDAHYGNVHDVDAHYGNVHDTDEIEQNYY